MRLVLILTRTLDLLITVGPTFTRPACHKCSRRCALPAAARLCCCDALCRCRARCPWDRQTDGHGTASIHLQRIRDPHSNVVRCWMRTQTLAKPSYEAPAGFVSCKKKNRNAKNMAGARAYMRVCGRCPQRGPGAEPLVRGSVGHSPLKLKAFYCRREQICHSHLSET